MTPSMRTFSSFLFLVSFVHYKIYMSRFSLFPRVGGQCMDRSDGTSSWNLNSKGTLRQTTDVVCEVMGEERSQTRTSFPFQPFNMWLLAQRDRVATQTHRVDTRGESLTKPMRRSCVEHLTETLSPQTEIWRLLLATKFQNEV